MTPELQRRVERVIRPFDPASASAREPLEFTHDQRYIAACYHGGQWSELYKVNASGKYDDLNMLEVEVESAIKIAEKLHNYLDAEVLGTMQALIDHYRLVGGAA